MEGFLKAQSVKFCIAREFNAREIKEDPSSINKDSAQK